MNGISYESNEDASLERIACIRWHLVVYKNIQYKYIITKDKYKIEMGIYDIHIIPKKYHTHILSTNSKVA